MARRPVSGSCSSAPELGYDRRDRDQIVRVVTERFARAGWEVPRLLAELPTATDLWFDQFAQIHLDRWSQGRIALLGDAAWAAGPGGGGTGLAMTGAYVLAAELAAANGDHTTAFTRYEAALRKGATAGQKQARNAGPFLAPPTAKKIRSRDRAYRMLSSRLLLPLFVRLERGRSERSAPGRLPRRRPGRRNALIVARSRADEIDHAAHRKQRTGPVTSTGERCPAPFMGVGHLWVGPSPHSQVANT